MSPIRSLARLVWQSLWSRRVAVGFVILAVAVSTTLYLSVERLRTGARASFAATVSGTDLVVGARSGGVQLILYSVFRIGNATSDISWDSARRVAALPGVAWTVPLALGDSHRGYRVVGTSRAYFDRLRYGRDRALAFRQGRPFEDLFDLVLGAEVAEALGYEIGDSVTVAHGLGRADLVLHDDLPFTVSGILERTGTPVDRSLHVSMEAIQAIHVDWRAGVRARETTPADVLRGMELEPSRVTALLVGTTSRARAFRVARAINSYEREPLLAVLPGVALQELWAILGTAEQALSLVSLMVVLTAIVGLVATILATLEGRRREVAILRTLGAPPGTIAGLLVCETLAVALLGIALGTAVVVAAQPFVSSWAQARYGLDLAAGFSARDAGVLGAITLAAALAGLLPAWRAYAMSNDDVAL